MAKACGAAGVCPLDKASLVCLCTWLAGNSRRNVETQTGAQAQRSHRAGQRGKPNSHGALGLWKWSGSPPDQTPPVLRMLKVSQKRAPNKCKTGLSLRFQSVRFTLYCVSSKNYPSIIDLPSLKMFRLCVSFTQAFFFPHLCCQHSTKLLQRVLLEKECIPAFSPHLRLLCLWIEPWWRQSQGRKG